MKKTGCSELYIHICFSLKDIKSLTSFCFSYILDYKKSKKRLDVRYEHQVRSVTISW